MNIIGDNNQGDRINERGKKVYRSMGRLAILQKVRLKWSGMVSERFRRQHFRMNGTLQVF